MIHCWFMRTVCVESLVNRGAADGTATDCSKVWLKELTHVDVDTFKTVWIYPVQKSSAPTAAQSADLRFSRCVFGEFLPRPGHWPTMHSAVAKGPYFFALFGFLLVSPRFLLISLWVFEINHWMLKTKECLDSSHRFSMCISLSISVPVPSVMSRAPQAAPRPQTEPRVEPARGATGTRVNMGQQVSSPISCSLV